MELHNWLIFSSIALVATLTPGPAVLLVTTHSLSFGLQKSIFSILGNISGLFLMSLFSVLGLSTVVLCSATAFTFLKLIGAAYLIYLGVKLWQEGFAQTVGEVSRTPRHKHPSKLYFQGLTVALSNPKAIGFTTALFPQFIDHNASLVPQFTLLVASFMIYSFICLLLYGWLSVKTGNGLKNSRKGKMVSRLFATLFIGSGITLGATS